eukprot:scaffold11034_cov155-Skeletonema_dohrnii-CCMP3373.AAC.5
MESAEDAALNEALSMLDSLTPDDGFAIDSDDDDDDMNFNLDDELNQLEGIDLTNGGSKDEPTAAAGGADGDGLQSVNVAGGAADDKLDPPSHWATKQDVANMTAPTSSSSDAAAAAASVTVNTSTLKEKSIASSNNIATEAPLFHPLQDIGRPSPSTTAAAATTATTNDSSNNDSSDNRSSSWTSSFASFAKVATASIQSAVESAEATLIHQGEPIANGNVGSVSVGSGHQMNQNHQGLLNTKSGAAGGAVSTTVAAPMSYQERQRLLHQKYHAANNNNTATTTTNSNAAMMPASATVKGGAMTTQQKQQQSPTKSTQSINLKKPTTHHHHHTSPSRTIPPSSSRSSPTSYNTTNTNNTSSTSPPQATSTPKSSASSSSSSTMMTFLDKLTQNLDATTKNTLIAQAIGPLLPGERIIMFINNLKDVRDSRFGHLFVGSLEGVTTSFGLRDCLTGVGAGGVDGGVTTVWCCVMTFYRVILFSYEAGSEDGRVLLNDTNDGDDSELTGNSQGGGNNETIQQWLKSRNVSIQFQAAHQQPPSSSKRKHHVFQMPLASIERVEKVLSSSQSSPLSSNSANGVGGGGGGGYSYTNNLLPSSNAASSAMSQLGNQMKPLTGLVAGIAANSGGGGGSSNNLLMDNGSNNSGGPSSSSSVLATSGPLGIIIHGKDGGRWIKFSTSSYTDAARAHEALNTYAFPGRRNLGYLFAFESRRLEVMASSGAAGGGQQQQQRGGGDGGNPIATATPPTRRRFLAMEEFTRQGIVKSAGGGGVAHSSPWTVIHANTKNYGLCSSYPSVLVVPRSIVGSDDGNNFEGSGMGILRRCAAFRSENRFPVLTWGSSEHGGSIWRSSQPKVGLQGYRSTEDERYLYAIGEEAKRANLAADARAEGGVGSGSSVGRYPKEFLRMLCGRNNESDLIMEGSNSSCMLKIMDMRPKSAAMANRTQGYGYENTNYYRGSTINFYGIGNIHAVRDAYQKVHALCLNPNTSDIQWMQLVENTNWPSMTRLILSASWQTAFHVHYNRLPILLHCSHGWDRTSQVSALAQLMLDPHYRTCEGFSALVEKDFLSFGHPFHTRCGHGEGKNEQGGDEGQLSPIFLQFLDCVFQLVNQFPNFFEFNARYLLLLSENIYSCRFGTLLCDSEREREVVAGIRQRTYCMWEYLDSLPDLVNPLFNKAANDDAGVLMMPLSMLLRNVTLWTDRLCMYGAKATTPCLPPGTELDRHSTLHTSVDETADSLKRAVSDTNMWKETALSALKEVEELKKKIAKDEGENE